MTEKDYASAVMRNSQRLYLLAYSYTKNSADAEDIMQDCFLKLWNYNNSFNDNEHMDKWLTRVCINESKDLFKSFFKKTATDLSKANNIESFDEYFNIDLFNAVMSLPKKERIILHLYYYEDMQIKDISSLLQIKESTIKSLLRRSRQKLKSKLGDEWINE